MAKTSAASKGSGEGGGGSKALVPVIEFTEPRCKVCMSPHRRQIDFLLAKGEPLALIVRFFSQFHDPTDGRPPINRKNLASHRDRHLDLAKSAIRRHVERRAREEAANYDEALEAIVSHLAMLEGTLERAWQDVVAGKMRIGPMEMMALMDRIDRVRSQKEGIDADTLRLEFRAFMEAVRMLVGPEHYQSIYDQFLKNVERDKNPTMDVLSLPSDHVTEEPDEGEE